MTLEEAEEMAMRAKPCPFCGKGFTAQQYDCESTDFYIVHGDGEKCFVDVILIVESDLFKWNTRAPIAVTDAMVELAMQKYLSLRKYGPPRKSIQEPIGKIYPQEHAMRAALEAALNGGET